MAWEVLQGDVMERLRDIEDGSVHCCLTSPPYFNLRAYLPDNHVDKNKEVGTEETPEEYVEKMVEVFREVRRVLRDDGNLWINIGDSYAGSGKAGKNPELLKKHKMFGKPKSEYDTSIMTSPSPVSDEYKAKDLYMIPSLLALGLRADGWYLRSMIPWIRNSVMPESVTDRPSSAIEYFFLFSKSSRYYYDIEAVKKKVAPATVTRARSQNKASKRKDMGEAKWQGGLTPDQQDKYYDNISENTGRNRRNSDWFFESIEDVLNGVSGTFLHDEDGLPMCIFCNPQPYKGAHFAVFSPRLITPMILAGSSPRTCEICGAPWERVVERKAMKIKRSNRREQMGGHGRTQASGTMVEAPSSTTTGWKPTCSCQNKGEGKSIILDPFAGSGTTLWVAEHYGRDSIGIELNPEYCNLIYERMNNFQQTIFSEVTM